MPQRKVTASKFAQAALAGGRGRILDGLGCRAAWMRRRRHPHGLSAFLHEHDSAAQHTHAQTHRHEDIWPPHWAAPSDRQQHLSTGSRLVCSPGLVRVTTGRVVDVQHHHAAAPEEAVDYGAVLPHLDGIPAAAPVRPVHGLGHAVPLLRQVAVDTCLERRPPGREVERAVGAHASETVVPTAHGHKRHLAHAPAYEAIVEAPSRVHLVLLAHDLPEARQGHDAPPAVLADPAVAVRIVLVGHRRRGRRRPAADGGGRDVVQGLVAHARRALLEVRPSVGRGQPDGVAVRPDEHVALRQVVARPKLVVEAAAVAANAVPRALDCWRLPGGVGRIRGFPPVALRVVVVHEEQLPAARQRAPAEGVPAVPA
mmetsp:Transcript_69525/g.207160  ORF Transcript_69525/g.207160 Transcript_69525/m.207160 type:complete len:369 (+) Transcript_69525:26-1132(+)